MTAEQYTYAKVRIQCTAPCGKVGTYLAAEDNTPLSPIKPDFYALCQWLRKEGWQRIEGWKPGFEYRKAA